MFYSGFFAIFYRKTSEFGFWMDGLGTNPSNSEIFLKFPSFLKSWVLSCRQLMRQQVHSLSTNNNLVPFHLWWREILLKSEKVSNCFVQDCSGVSFYDYKIKKSLNVLLMLCIQYQICCHKVITGSAQPNSWIGFIHQVRTQNFAKN